MQITPNKLRELGACEEGIDNWITLGGDPTINNTPISPYANETRSYGIKVALKALRHALKEGHISRDDFDRDYYYLLKFKQDLSAVEQFFDAEYQDVYRLYIRGSLEAEYTSYEQAMSSYQAKVNLANNYRWSHYEIIYENPNTGFVLIQSEEGLTHSSYSFWSQKYGTWIKNMSREDVINMVNNDLDERCKKLFKPIILKQKVVEIDEQLVYWKEVYKDEQ